MLTSVRKSLKSVTFSEVSVSKLSIGANKENDVQTPNKQITKTNLKVSKKEFQYFSASVNKMSEWKSSREELMSCSNLNLADLATPKTVDIRDTTEDDFFIIPITDKVIYEGPCYQDPKTGLGEAVIFSDNGQVFEGSIKNGWPNGLGTFTSLQDNIVIKGTFSTTSLSTSSMVRIENAEVISTLSDGSASVESYEFCEIECSFPFIPNKTK